MSDLKLLSVKPSPKAEKKLVATFERDGREKKVHFGQRGAPDFTKTRDKEQRRRYIERHKRNENWNDPTSPGALSKHLLWGESTSLMRNVAAFRKRFSL